MQLVIRPFTCHLLFIGWNKNKFTLTFHILISLSNTIVLLLLLFNFKSLEKRNVQFWKSISLIKFQIKFDLNFNIKLYKFSFYKSACQSSSWVSRIPSPSSSSSWTSSIPSLSSSGSLTWSLQIHFYFRAGKYMVTILTSTWSNTWKMI